MPTLTWHPAATSPTAPSSRTSTSAAHDHNTLVVLLSWAFASPKYVSKYVDFIHKLGADCATFQPSVAGLWSPALARHHAQSLTYQLEAHLAIKGPRPVVFALFSGACKMLYCEVLTLMHPMQTLDGLIHVQGSAHHSTHQDRAAVTEQPGLNAAGSGAVSVSPSGDQETLQHEAWQRLQDWVLKECVVTAGPSIIMRPTYKSPHSCFPVLRSCVCGHWFDSSPVDFVSEVGSRMMAPPESGRWWWRSLVQLASGAGDFFFWERWESQRAWMWAVLAFHPLVVRTPSLFMYSQDDPYTDADRISGLARLLRWQGADVTSHCWSSSEHCSHMRHHPYQYEDLVRGLLGHAQDLFHHQHSQHNTHQAHTSQTSTTSPQHATPLSPPSSATPSLVVYQPTTTSTSVQGLSPRPTSHSSSSRTSSSSHHYQDVCLTQSQDSGHGVGPPLRSAPQDTGPTGHCQVPPSHVQIAQARSRL